MLNALDVCQTGPRDFCPLKTGNSGGLPGRANATIRSPAAGSIT
jgi:hypothetical protein